MRYLLFLILIAVALTACTGDETTEVDKSAPWKPDLIHHLGDTGDLDPVTYTYETPDGVVQNTIPSGELSDENNGIDTVPSGNWIRLQWAPFVNNDIAFLRVYRYRQGQDEPTLVDSVRDEGQLSYVDQTLNQTNISQEWFYYIDLYDESGNHTKSDTVSYMTVPKVLLSSPIEGAVLDSSDDLEFQWQILQTSSVSMYRVLLMQDEGGEDAARLWHYDETDTDPQEIYLSKSYTGPVLPPGDYLWRVDAITNSAIESGSESQYFQFTIE